MADYPVDDDVEDLSIKDSTGTTVAVLVQSKNRRLAAEERRAAFASLPVFDNHEVLDDDLDECIPNLDTKGKITGRDYTRKNANICSQNGQRVQRRYPWENFMDRLNSDKEHYPILDERGNMMCVNSIPKQAAIPAAIHKEEQKKISDYY